MPTSCRRTRGRATRSTLALVVAAALLATSSCSYIFIDLPPQKPAPHERINCTTNYAAPIIDIALGVLELVSFAVVESTGSRDQKTLVPIIGIPLATGEIGAAIWGFRKVSACNDLTALHERYRPRKYVPPPPSGNQPRTQSPEAPPPVQTAPAPPGTAAPSPPVPRVRQQMDGE